MNRRGDGPIVTGEGDATMADPATMDTLPEPLRTFSLSSGGWLSSRLNRISPVKRALLVAVVAWVPVAMLTAAFGTRSPEHAVPLTLRLLVSLPLLIVAEPFIDGRLRACLRQLYESRVLEPSGRLEMPPLVARAARLVAASRVETLLALLSLGMSLSALLPPVVLTGQTLPEPARVYFLLISFPLFRFVLLRWVWRFTVWAMLLWKLARLPIQPQVTHPDRSGGLAFLGRQQGSFGAVVLGMSFTVAGFLHVQAVSPDVAIIRQFAPLVVLALAAVVVIFAPLLAFVPVLVRARRLGLLQMGLLASRHSQRFEQTWFKSDRDPLAAPDMSSLTDLGSSYEVAIRMRFVPMSLQPVLLVVVAAMLPALPILAKEGQLLEILTKIGGSLI